MKDILIVSILFISLQVLVTCELVLPLTKLEMNLDDAIRTRATAGEAILLPGGYNYGEYHILVTPGSKMQQYYLQVDTGSSDLLVYYYNCSGACANVTFTPSSSTSFVTCQTTTNFECPQCFIVDAQNNDVCGFVDQYGSGSIVEGFVATDVLKVGEFPFVNIDFGMIGAANTIALENSPTAGIWGLAYPILSSWNGVTAFEHIVTQTGIEDMFSMCLVNSQAVMTMGIDYSTNPAFEWVALTNHTYYPIQPLDLQVNGQSLGLPTSDFGLTIVDSGTTLLGLATPVYDAFKSAVQSICSTTTLVGGCPSDDNNGNSLWKGYCWQMTAAQQAEYPTFSITLAGVAADVSVTLGPSDYFTSPASLNGLLCLGVFESGSLTILGDVFMSKNHVVFDRVNSKLGFGPLTTCPTPTTSTTGTNPLASQGDAMSLAIAYLLVVLCLVMAI